LIFLYLRTFVPKGLNPLFPDLTSQRYDSAFLFEESDLGGKNPEEEGKICNFSTAPSVLMSEMNRMNKIAALKTTASNEHLLFSPPFPWGFKINSVYLP
jgi:hypothetical protein